MLNLLLNIDDKQTRLAVHIWSKKYDKIVTEFSRKFATKTHK